MSQEINKPVTETEIQILAREKLPKSKAVGLDRISNEIISSCLQNKQFLGIFKQLSNKIMDSEIHPDSWKIDLIKPIHKKNITGKETNYRGISLSSCEIHPDQWKIDLIKLIHKKNTTSKETNYRGISLSSCEIHPDSWKIDLIKPIHKKNTTSKETNYRGISLSSCLGKGGGQQISVAHGVPRLSRSVSNLAQRLLNILYFNIYYFLGDHDAL